jgi:small subunit ribosomal protein S8
MVLLQLAHICSHLQNASMARLATTSIPPTTLNLVIALALQDHGFIASVTRGNTAGPDLEPTPTTQENISRRKLWLTLKYHDNEPVLSKLRLISKPKKRIWMGVKGLEHLASGKVYDFVRPPVLGEVFFLTTDKGVVDMREAIDRRMGGQLLCRVR